MNAPVRPQRLAWAITGSGHYFTECFELMREVPALDLFVTRAAHEVVRMYRQKLDTLPSGVRIFKDTTASAAPVGLFYQGVYHTLVVAPATSNTVAKCVYGISDTLATNVYAQAETGWTHSHVFGCEPCGASGSQGASGIVKAYPGGRSD